MKTIPTVILCGGRGTRMREMTQNLPKPMVPIGQRPIIWHIMKWYAHFQRTDFVLALGWRAEAIKSFVLHQHLYLNDFVVETGRIGAVHGLDGPGGPDENWRITCVDTGLDTHTGTRLRQAAERVPGDRVMVTYGDVLSDIDVDALLDFHHAHGRLVTLSAVRPPGQYGEVRLGGDGTVERFVEKPSASDRWVNGGFMVFEREAIDSYIPADQDVMLEQEPFAALAADGELTAYQHRGFWQSMESPADHAVLEEAWHTRKAPWRTDTDKRCAPRTGRG